MAATENVRDNAVGQGKLLGAIVMAALSLPGVLPSTARADNAPEKGAVEVRYLHYQDRQAVQTKYPDYTGNEPSSLTRIKADSPSVYVLAPLGAKWAVEGSAVHDQVSGASPRYYTSVSGATTAKGMHDERTAADAKVTRYFERASVGFGVATSSEHDYKSNALSVDTRISSPDNNRTWNFGIGASNDRISSTNDPMLHKTRHTYELIGGVTQALTRNDLAQVNLSFANGNGYYSDPYKLFDARPDNRQQAALLARWNHHFSRFGSTLRGSYRYYNDSFGIRAHTAEAAWVQPVTPHIALTPSMRYYSQSAASFYYDPVTDTSLFPGPVGKPEFSTTDQRMSAFGAVTVGLKAELRFGDWSTDLKFEHYEQRSNWRVLGKGSPGIDPFSADSVQFGVRRTF